MLYLDFENDPRGDIRSRLIAMGVTPDQIDHLHYPEPERVHVAWIAWLTLIHECVSNLYPDS